MSTIGFHASQEQLAPSALVRTVQRAEEAGFRAAMCSDHLAPWSARQGHSGYSWSWLGGDGDPEDCVLLDLLDRHQPEHHSNGSTVDLKLGGYGHVWFSLQPRRRNVTP